MVLLKKILKHKIPLIAFGAIFLTFSWKDIAPNLAADLEVRFRDVHLALLDPKRDCSQLLILNKSIFSLVANDTEATNLEKNKFVFYFAKSIEACSNRHELISGEVSFEALLDEAKETGIINHVALIINSEFYLLSKNAQLFFIKNMFGFLQNVPTGSSLQQKFIKEIESLPKDVMSEEFNRMNHILEVLRHSKF